MRDLIVAGGGPVGLAAAIHAARAGLDVEVREPRTGVIDKACGEGLMPGAVAALREIGVVLEGHEIDGIRYVAGTTIATAGFRTGPGRGVRRIVLHAALGEVARAAGVRIEHRAVGSIEQRDDRVLVDGDPARYLLAADGLHSRIRTMLGLDAPARGVRRHGLRAHVAMAPWTSFVEVHWAAGSEAYVTPVAPDQVGVAILAERKGSFADQLSEHRALRDRFAGVAMSPVLGAGPLRQRTRRRVVGRVLLVGDAAGYIDALTGEGIGIGLAQARAAIRAIMADDPASYETAWRRIGRRHALLTHGLLAATRFGPVRAAIVPAAARLPRVFEAAVHQLASPL